jgi:phage shock protein A
MAASSTEGLWNRIKRFFFGEASLRVDRLERGNPEAVYAAAIDERIQKHAELKKAVSGIVYLQNKITDELAAKEKELRDIVAALPMTVQSGNDDDALALLQRKNQLEPAIAGLREDLAKVSAQAEDSRKAIEAFRADIEKLKRERDETLARKATAEARIKLQESLEGLSTDADLRALENVREHVGKLEAQADVGSALKAGSLETRLQDVRERAADATARAQLEEMKRQAQAQAAVSVGGDVPKSI